MEVKNLELAAISFTAAPTKTQLTNALREIHGFLGKVGGSLLMDGSYSIADQPLGVMLNAAVALKQSADLFDQGPNVAGLATPMPAPGQVRR